MISSCLFACTVYPALAVVGQLDTAQVVALLAKRYESYAALPREYKAAYEVAYAEPMSLKTPKGDLRRFDAEEVLQRSKTIVRADKDRVYYHGSHYVWYEADLKLPNVEFVAFDGTTLREMHYKGMPLAPGGTIGADSELLKKVRSYKLDSGSFLFGELSGENLLSILTNPSSQFARVEKKESGRDRLELRCESDRIRHRLVLDPDQEYRLVEWELNPKGEAGIGAGEEDTGAWIVGNIAYTAFDGEYFPVAGTISHFIEIPGQESRFWTGSIALSEVQLHRAFEGEDFTIHFPEGTELIDRSTGIAYKLGSNGERDLLFSPEAAKPMDEVLASIDQDGSARTAKTGRDAVVKGRVPGRLDDAESKLGRGRGRYFYPAVALVAGSAGVILGTLLLTRRDGKNR